MHRCYFRPDIVCLSGIGHKSTDLKGVNCQRWYYTIAIYIIYRERFLACLDVLTKSNIRISSRETSVALEVIVYIGLSPINTYLRTSLFVIGIEIKLRAAWVRTLQSHGNPSRGQSVSSPFSCLYISYCRSAGVRPSSVNSGFSEPLHGSIPNFVGSSLSTISPDHFFFQNFQFPNFDDFVFIFVNPRDPMGAKMSKRYSSHIFHVIWVKLYDK